jgi:hypothetical protein
VKREFALDPTGALSGPRGPPAKGAEAEPAGRRPAAYRIDDLARRATFSLQVGERTLSWRCA